MKFLIDLPKDVLLLILEHCTPKSLGRLRITCKSLNDLFFSPALWKLIVILNGKAHQSFLTKLISKTRWGIKKIIASDPSIDLMTEIFKTNVADVRLLNILEFSQDKIPVTVKRLDIHSQLNIAASFSFSMGSNLTQIHLLVQILPELLLELKRTCLHLDNVTLGNCSDVSNIELIMFIQGFKKWNYLALLGARNINDAFLQVISKNDITHLVLHSCDLITDNGIFNLGQSKDLQWIKVIRCRGLSLGAFDNTMFESTLYCVMEYSDFVNGNSIIHLDAFAKLN